MFSFIVYTITKKFTSLKIYANDSYINYIVEIILLELIR